MQEIIAIVIFVVVMYFVLRKGKGTKCSHPCESLHVHHEATHCKSKVEGHREVTYNLCCGLCDERVEVSHATIDHEYWEAYRRCKKEGVDLPEWEKWT